MTQENENTAQPEGVGSLKALLPYLFRHKVLLTFGTIAVLFSIVISFGVVITFKLKSFFKKK